MKFFSLFSTKAVDPADLSSVSSSSRSSPSKSGKSTKSSKSAKNATTQIVVSEPKDSDNYKCIKSFLESMNNYDPEKPEDYMKTFLSHFQSEKTKIYLEDGERFPALKTAQLLISCFQSFPDFRIVYDNIGEKENEITVNGVRGSGTHTGADFNIAPGLLPALPASGKKMENDEERYIFKMKDGKIRRGEVIALGNQSGFEGMYTSLGGSLVPPAALESNTAA